MSTGVLSASDMAALQGTFDQACKDADEIERHKGQRTEVAFLFTGPRDGIAVVFVESDGCWSIAPRYKRPLNGFMSRYAEVCRGSRAS